MITALEIYNSYPRHEGRRKALLEIERALNRIRKEAPHLSHCTDEQLAAMMLTTVTYFAKSPAGQKGVYTPHPSTWFHQGRYLDDPEAWNLREESKSESLAQRNADAFATVFGKLPKQNSAPVFAHALSGRIGSMETVSRKLPFDGD